MTADHPNEEAASLKLQTRTTTEDPPPPETQPPEDGKDSAESPSSVEEQSLTEPVSVEASAEAEKRPLTLADLRPGMKLSGKVVNITPLGAFVSVDVERDGLVHMSEIQKAKREGKIKNGDEIEVWVLKADRKANRLSLGLEEKTPLKQLKPGMTLRGRIVRLTKFGAFVDVGAVTDGLLHSDEIRRENQEGKLKVGQEIQVSVRSVNRKSRRLSLGLGQRTPLGDIKAGAEIDGRITRLAEFGAFVDIGATVDGLVHVSELPGGGSPADVLSVGQRSRVRVRSVDQERRRISLTMKGMRQLPSAQMPAETEHFPTSMEIALREAEEHARQKRRGRRH